MNRPLITLVLAMGLSNVSGASEGPEGLGENVRNRLPTSQSSEKTGREPPEVKEKSDFTKGVEALQRESDGGMRNESSGDRLKEIDRDSAFPEATPTPTPTPSK